MIYWLKNVWNSFLFATVLKTVGDLKSQKWSSKGYYLKYSWNKIENGILLPFQSSNLRGKKKRDLSFILIQREMCT